LAAHKQIVYKLSFQLSNPGLNTFNSYCQTPNLIQVKRQWVDLVFTPPQQQGQQQPHQKKELLGNLGIWFLVGKLDLIQLDDLNSFNWNKYEEENILGQLRSLKLK
jgi:hypothetical protein